LRSAPILADARAADALKIRTASADLPRFITWGWIRGAMLSYHQLLLRRRKTFGRAFQENRPALRTTARRRGVVRRQTAGRPHPEHLSGWALPDGAGGVAHRRDGPASFH